MPCHGLVAHLFTRTAWQRHLHSRSRKERRTRSCHFRAIVQVWRPQTAQLRNLSAKHALSQARASTSWKYHEANKTITEMSLSQNEIGDGGAIALAESLKATLLISFCSLCATQFVVHGANVIVQETFCHLCHVSVGMSFCETAAF